MYLPLEYSDGFSSNPTRKEDVEWLQRALVRAGMDPGEIDGAYGQKTADAVSLLETGGDGMRYGAMQHDELLSRAYDNSTSGPLPEHSHSLLGVTGGVA